MAAHEIAQVEAVAAEDPDPAEGGEGAHVDGRASRIATC